MKGNPEITEPVQREKTGLEPKELVVEVHSSGDCCGGDLHENKADASHAGVNPLHVDSSASAIATSFGCCGSKHEDHAAHDHSVHDQAQASKGLSCCDKKNGHKHKHSHSHGERQAPPGSTSVFSTVVGDEIVVNAQESIAHQEHHKKVQTTVLLDNLGIAASTLCLIHCMAMPFLIALLPFLGLQFLEGELAHRVIALFVFAFAIFAIGPGYMQHRKKQVLYATIFGLSLVAGALLIAGPMFGENYELPFITTGNLILVITHLRNRKLCQCVH